MDKHAANPSYSAKFESKGSGTIQRTQIASNIQVIFQAFLRLYNLFSKQP